MENPVTTLSSLGILLALIVAGMRQVWRRMELTSQMRVYRELPPVVAGVVFTAILWACWPAVFGESVVRGTLKAIFAIVALWIGCFVGYGVTRFLMWFHERSLTLEASRAKPGQSDESSPSPSEQ